MNEGNKIMTKRKVFVSFDPWNDLSYRRMVEDWAAGTNIEFVFSMEPPPEVDENTIREFDKETMNRIKSADCTLVIVGKEANKPHRHSRFIGFKNWMNFEIHHSKRNGKKILAVKIDEIYELPDELIRIGAAWSTRFTAEDVMNLLGETRTLEHDIGHGRGSTEHAS